MQSAVKLDIVPREVFTIINFVALTYIYDATQSDTQSHNGKRQIFDFNIHEYLASTVLDGFLLVLFMRFLAQNGAEILLTENYRTL